MPEGMRTVNSTVKTNTYDLLTTDFWSVRQQAWTGKAGEGGIRLRYP